MRTFVYIALVSTLFIFSACQDKIDIKLDQGTSQLAVDAFISNQPSTQKIRLTKTSGYFDNSPSPSAIGAVVKVTDNNNGKVFNFIDANSSGNYLWTPAPGDSIGVIGDRFTLSITYSGEQYVATSVMNPAPIIDSISSVYQPANPSLGIAREGFIASFFATDFPETTDFYWIKSYRNDTANTNPSNIITAYDAAYGPGANGFPFILPIRQGITPQTNLFRLNDSVRVEIHAITRETYNFLAEVVTQTTNGGLFATPPANIRTNVKNINADSKVKATGFFNIGAVTTLGKKMK